jgi:hypothetical protein
VEQTPGAGICRKILGEATRRGMIGAALGAAATRALAPGTSEAKKKKKVTLCFSGKTIKVPKKKKKRYLKRGAVPGACPPATTPPPTVCTPNCGDRQCGDDGCGQPCGLCNPGETCPAGQCVCLDERVCGEVCCPKAVECFVDGCVCEGFLCSCAEGTFCSTPDLDEQCCLDEDTCDPQLACVAETCAAGNGVCALGEAFCGDGTDCLCATSLEGDPFCADFASFTACPTTSQCSSEEPCGGAGEACVDVWCCTEDGSPLGVCLTACPQTVARGVSTRARARSRQRVQGILHAHRRHH